MWDQITFTPLYRVVLFKLGHTAGGIIQNYFVATFKVLTKVILFAEFEAVFCQWTGLFKQLSQLLFNYFSLEDKF